MHVGQLAPLIEPLAKRRLQKVGYQLVLTPQWFLALEYEDHLALGDVGSEPRESGLRRIKRRLGSSQLCGIGLRSLTQIEAVSALSEPAYAKRSVVVAIRVSSRVVLAASRLSARFPRDRDRRPQVARAVRSTAVVVCFALFLLDILLVGLATSVVA